MFRLRYTSVSGFPRMWLTARMPCPATRSPLVTPDVQISRIRRSQIPLPWACTRSCWLLLGRSAQLLSQKREFRRPLPRVRNQSFPQAVLPSSYTSTYLAGPLRSTGITPLHRYYAPRRLPTRAAETVMLSRPALDHVVHPVGSLRFLLDRSTHAVPYHPGEPTRCTCLLLPWQWQASPLSEGWPLSSTCFEAETGSLYYGLRLRPNKASHPGLLRRTLIGLHVEQAIYMTDSFQSARPRKLRLTHRKTRNGRMTRPRMGNGDGRGCRDVMDGLDLLIALVKPPMGRFVPDTWTEVHAQSPLQECGQT